MDLDERLALSAPPTTKRTYELHTGIAALVSDTEAKQRPRPRSRRIAATVVASLLITVGGVAVAGANGLIAPPFDWSGESGRSCTSQLTWFTFNETGGETMSRDWPDEIQQQTKHAAMVFTSGYDFSAIDRAQAVEEFRAEEKRIIDNAPPGEAQPRMTTEEAELSSVYGAYFDELRAYLDGQGLPMETITPNIAYTCE
ncbi:MAG TPA: hypothetical protein PKE40_14375 [Arachnia sp.]|nr:hypothetical protein [Arachnia sp.]HMT87530.1 hypothetical protein [Arachnia sp.]